MTIECIIHNQTIFNQWHPKKLLTEACYVNKSTWFSIPLVHFIVLVFFLKEKSADVLSSENNQLPPLLIPYPLVSYGFVILNAGILLHSYFSLFNTNTCR